MRRPAPRRLQPIAHPGPLLLADVGHDPSWIAHRSRTGAVPHLDVETLAAWTDAARLRGRGGAGFPFSRKLTTAAKRRAVERLAVRARAGVGSCIRPVGTGGNSFFLDRLPG